MHKVEIMWDYRSMNLGRIFRGLVWVLLVSSPFFLVSRPLPVRAADGCTPGSFCTYLPLVSRAVSDDLQLNSVEITQAVQDTQNLVPLVAGRSTMIRIYAAAKDATQAIAGVQVRVTASRAGAPLSGSPYSFTSTVPLSNNRADMNSTLNTLLPSSWLSGIVDVTISLDPDNLINESDESNNSRTFHLTFNPVPALNIKIVPIRYTHVPNGRTYAAPSVDTISGWMYRIYPVSQINITWHSAYSFSGDLSGPGDWERLLDVMTSLKSSEGASSSQVYYGLVPITDGSLPWFSSGIAGIGWVGLRASVGLDLSSSASRIAAHELGHNLGMGHTPCGVSTGADPAFPYTGGTIGQYGVDVATGTLYSPATYRDLMGYCTPQWISDYTYKKIMQNQVGYGASQQFSLSAPAAGSQAQRSLLVRAQFGPHGVKLLPSYLLRAQQNTLPDAGEYRLQMVGAGGRILSETPVRQYSLALEGAESAAVHALVPLPEQPVETIRLVKDGVLLAEQALQALPVEPPLVEASPDGRGWLVRWDPSAGPVMVRYSSDGGQTWTTLGVDLSGGLLKVAASDLPVLGGQFEVISANRWN